MQRLLQALPHILTLTNLAAGCIACIALLQANYHWIPWLLLTSAGADFLDGFAARAVGVSGPFGRELDSLADMVSFGVSPALMAYVMLTSGLQESVPTQQFLAYGGLLIALFSALRLARFNIAQADTKHFIGLATPANTVLWFALFMTWHTDSLGLRQNLSQPGILLPLVGLSSFLLVSSITYFSNKIAPNQARNWPAGVIALAAIILPATFDWAGLAMTAILYVASGLVWRPAE